MNPTIRSPLARIACAAALAFAGCAQYATVSEKRPTYTYRPITRVGAIIARAVQTGSKSPEATLGRYLDAAAEAQRELRAQPSDATARRDYNFAVGRVFE